MYESKVFVSIANSKTLVLTLIATVGPRMGNYRYLHRVLLVDLHWPLFYLPIRICSIPGPCKGGMEIVIGDLFQHCEFSSECLPSSTRLTCLEREEKLECGV